MNPDINHSDADDAWIDAALRRYTSTRDKNLRDEIAARASWLATRSARRFWDKGEPFDDLVQVAQIGLLKAIDRFEPERGVPFGAFATPTITGELRRHFRDYTWSVHVPRRAKDQRTAVNAANDELSRQLGRSPLVSEIASHLRLTTEAVIEALEANSAYRTVALDTSPHGADAAGQGGAPERDYEVVLNREVLSTLLEHLPARERMILHLRFTEEMSQAQIAERIGTSQVHVGRLIASSLATLRGHLDPESASSD